MERAGRVGITKTHEATFESEKYSIILIIVMILPVYAYVKIYQILYFNHTQFIVCLLYLKSMFQKCGR